MQAAPSWTVAGWLGGETSLEALRGRVIALHAFQMLCPGCVSHGIPQAQRLHATFGPKGLAVVGLHSVFEHHEVMGRAALEAFVHEYRLPFPVAVDAHRAGDPMPITMRAYGMRGTPSLVLIDALGQVRYHAFGRPSDLEVGAVVGQLLAEAPEACGPEGCVLPAGLAAR